MALFSTLLACMNMTRTVEHNTTCQNKQLCALQVNKTAKKRAQTAEDARAAEQPLKAAQTLRRNLRRRGHMVGPAVKDLAVKLATFKCCHTFSLSYCLLAQPLLLLLCRQSLRKDKTLSTTCGKKPSHG